MLGLSLGIEVGPTDTLGGSDGNDDGFLVLVGLTLG